MSQRLEIPVLKVNLATIHQVDLQNVKCLHNMWAVFSHCASVLEEGRRLENLSWRVWNRETLCHDSAIEARPSTITTRSIEKSDAGETLPYKAVPSIANSLVAEELSLRHQHTHPVAIVRHTDPTILKKMVTAITEKKPLSIKSDPPLHPSSNCSFQKSSLLSPPCVANPTVVSGTNVLRGFSPARKISHSHLLPQPSSITISDITETAPSCSSQPRAKTMFALGGSSGEESYDLCRPTHLSSCVENKKSSLKKNNAVFSFGASSCEDEAHLAKSRSAPKDKAVRRKTTFQEEVVRRTIREEAIVDDVFETDDEDYVDESAIDDEDDSSDWEDSVEGSGNASMEEKNLFKRVDSRLNLTSRRSLITTMLHQHDRMEALVNAATNSKSSSAIHSSTMMSSRDHSVSPASAMEMPTELASISEIPRSQSRPIARQGIHSHQLALSPRTTRRNMLASELTVSLRQHLLWERKQKSQTANAVLKRRHTSHDVAQLRQYPETSFIGKDEIKGSWDKYYEGGLGEYNSRGW